MSEIVTEFFVPEIPILKFKFSEDKTIEVDPVEVDSFVEQWFADNEKSDQYELLRYCYSRFKEVGRGKRDFVTLGQFREIMNKCWEVVNLVKKNSSPSSDSLIPTPEPSPVLDSTLDNSSSSTS